MHAEYREKISLQSWLPASHPTVGILRGDENLTRGAEFLLSSTINSPPPRRPISPELLADLESYHRDVKAPDGSFHSLRLFGEGAAAVVTGQQAGLLGGPMLTAIKCLAAIRLSRNLTETFQRPFVPVFWMASEDHDVDEVNRASTLDTAHQPSAFSLPWPDSYRLAPTGSLPLGGEARQIVQSFFRASGRTEFSDRLEQGLLDDLDEQPTFGGWFARQILRLFGSMGLVVIDSLDARVMRHGRPLWARVLEEPLRLTEECRRSGLMIRQLGYRPILEKKEKRCPFFLVSEGRRLPVFYERKAFVAGERSFTLLELRRLLESRPLALSAAVHLRPLLQDYLLPTAVFIAGPTELAYFPQVLPGYSWAEIQPPSLLLRPGLTLVEPVTRRLLDRFQLQPAGFHKGIDAPLRNLLRRENRFASPGRWEKVRESAARPLQRLMKEAEGKRELSTMIGQTAGKVDFLIRDLEKKALASLRKGADSTRSQLEKVGSHLFPESTLQERILSPYYFLNKYGPSLLEALLKEMPGDSTHHHFIDIVP